MSFWDAIKKGIGDLFRDASFRIWIIGVAVPLLIKSLAKAVPFLGWPGVGWIVAWGVDKGVELLYLVAQMKALDLSTEAEVNEYNQAIGELRSILRKDGATKEEINAAADKARRRVDELLDFSKLRRNKN